MRKFFALFVLFGCLTIPQVVPAATTIQWDVATRKFVTGGGYARVKRILTGELALVYGSGSDVYIRKSSNNGSTWGAAINVAHTDGYNNTNSEITQLANGWLLYSWNGRPSAEGVRPYTIKTKISRDNGNTWGDERTLYSADTVFANGVWEPVAMQLPSGEIQLFFANENPFRATAEQEITLMRSFDNGLTWGSTKRVSYRTGFRDGMPVPVYLLNNRGMAFAIEDNGINGTFKPVIIWSSSVDNWNQVYADGASTRRWHALRSDVQLASAVYGGAPYLVQLPGGETLLSIQSTEGRPSNVWNTSIMQVYTGDGDAKNFADRSTPFTNVPSSGNAMWNSLAVLDNNTVMAISTVIGAGQDGIWTVIGRVTRSAAGATRIIGPGGKCVDVAGDNTGGNGAVVQLWDCQSTSTDQLWTWNGTSLRTLGRCLDIIGNGTANATQVHLWDCNGVGGQQWQQQTNGSLRNPQSGRCLDSPGGAIVNGTRLQIWDCNGSAAQVFRKQ